MICVLYYAAVFPFVAIAKPYFESEFGLSPTEAALLNSIIYIMSAPLSPCFGLLIDFVGFNASFIVLANCLCLTGHLILGFIPVTPWLGVVIIGISYSMLASSLWPLVSLLVERHQLGTAYGFMQSWQNLGLAVIAIAAGSIAEKGWIKIEVFFSCLVLASTVCSIGLWILNKSQNGKCNINKIAVRRNQARADDLLPGYDNPGLDED